MVLGDSRLGLQVGVTCEREGEDVDLGLTGGNILTG